MSDLKRNDIPGAIAEYREAVARAQTRVELADLAEELVMMQDTEELADELLAELERVNAEPAIAKRLDELGPLTFET